MSIRATLPDANAGEAVRVDVPTECGSREAFLKDVAALQRTTTARLTVQEVTITRRDAQSYELRLVSPEGPRIVVDADCHTLLKTAAVIAATLAQAAPAEPAPPRANADASAGGVDATQGSPVTTTPSTAAERNASQTELSLGEGPLRSASAPLQASDPLPSEAASRATEPHSPGRSTALQLGAGAAGFAGLSPEPHLGLELLAGLHGERWGTHLAARLLPPRSMLIRDGLGLRQTVWGARLSGAFQLTSWLRWSLGLSGYWISAQGLGVTEPSTDGIGLLAPELEVAASVLIQPAFRAELGVQGRMGLTRPRFELEAGQVVYELPRVGGAAVLRILWTEP